MEVLVPLITLALGAGLANLLKFSELRSKLRLDAADELANLSTSIWDKGSNDSWLKKNAAVSRTSIRLRLAGVNTALIERLDRAAEEFWQSVEKIDGDTWSGNTDLFDQWAEVSGYIVKIIGANNRLLAFLAGRDAARQLALWQKQDEQLIDSLGK